MRVDAVMDAFELRLRFSGCGPELSSGLAALPSFPTEVAIDKKAVSREPLICAVSSISLEIS